MALREVVRPVAGGEKIIQRLKRLEEHDDVQGATDASREEEDVTIQLTWKGKSVPSRKLTVSAPRRIQQTLNKPANPSDSALGAGFRTLYDYPIRDMFAGILPAELELNEPFGAWVSDYQGENWPPPSATSVWTNSYGHGEVSRSRLA